MLNSNVQNEQWQEVGHQSVFDKMRNCEGCAKRKDFLMRHGFWTGVVVGVVGVYAFHKFVKPIPGKNG